LKLPSPTWDKNNPNHFHAEEQKYNSFGPFSISFCHFSDFLAFLQLGTFIFNRFIYTGEVFVPQHELQGFLRTAELLEIKGLLKDVDEVSWPQQGVSGSTQPMSHQQQQINNNNSLSSMVQTTSSKLTLPINLNNSSSNNNNSSSNGMIGNSSQTVLPSLPTVPVSTIVLTNAMADSKSWISVTNRQFGH
jgi:hypothetical protein